MRGLASNPTHAVMSKSEKFRHSAAKIVKTILFFGLPVLLSGMLVFVTGVIYIVRPYFHTKDFMRTTCQISGYTVHSKGLYSCSDGTDPFHPCVKIEVMYGISNATSYHESVIMENEQALVSCNQCSYTFGKHGLLHPTQDECNTWQDIYDPMDCVSNFIMRNVRKDVPFPCFFNPIKPNEVVRDLVVDSNAVIHVISWPILMFMVYCLGLLFVCYDKKQMKLFDEYIKSDIANNRKAQELQLKVAQERTKSRLGRSLGVHQFEFNLSSQQNISMPPFLSHRESATVVIGDSQLSHDQIDAVASDGDMLHTGLENLDLRHLDLAVSPRNIEDLAAAAHSPVEELGYITFQNKLASNDESEGLGFYKSKPLEVSCESNIPNNKHNMLDDDVGNYSCIDNWQGNSESTTSLHAGQMFPNNLGCTV